jgi:hypothetical protein
VISLESCGPYRTERGSAGCWNSTSLTCAVAIFVVIRFLRLPARVEPNIRRYRARFCNECFSRAAAAVIAQRKCGARPSHFRRR